MQLIPVKRRDREMMVIEVWVRRVGVGACPSEGDGGREVLWDFEVEAAMVVLI
jgi:hypothetical protein